MTNTTGDTIGGKNGDLTDKATCAVKFHETGNEIFSATSDKTGTSMGATLGNTAGNIMAELTFAAFALTEQYLLLNIFIGMTSPGLFLLLPVLSKCD